MVNEHSFVVIYGAILLYIMETLNSISTMSSRQFERWSSFELDIKWAPLIMATWCLPNHLFEIHNRQMPSLLFNNNDIIINAVTRIAPFCPCKNKWSLLFVSWFRCVWHHHRHRHQHNHRSKYEKWLGMRNTYRAMVKFDRQSETRVKCSYKT